MDFNKLCTMADSEYEAGQQLDQDVFEIPELPFGQHLELHLSSNWGDPNYIGFNSIEIFTESGERVKDVASTTCNVATLTGSLDTILNATTAPSKDPKKMWTASTTATDHITIRLEFHEPIRMAMVRVWNYNASRVRAQIGVRDVEMVLDGRRVFRGEIDCAFASDSEFEPQMGDTILFTTDEQILEAISDHDICLLPEMTQTLDISDQLTPFRPSTSEAKDAPQQQQQHQSKATEIRPVTATSRKPGDVKVLTITLADNWGMRELIGLTGIEIVEENNRVVDESNISASVSTFDSRTVRRLFNGRNLTRNLDDMWLVEFADHKPLTLSLRFATPITLKAISFWNYNASFELSYAGVKMVHVHVNGKLVMQNVLLRKAAGFVYFDYVQDVIIDPTLTIYQPPRPSTKTISGFVFQVCLLSSWGDEFYIGLNGIDIYNRKDEIMRVRENNLAAFPESVNILPQISNDLRTSGNLINGINDTDEARNMWLTPLLPNRCARVFFVFDTPTYVSKIVLWNYRKTPERGVRHFSISVDDIIVFSGEAPASTMDVTAKMVIDLRNT